MQNKKIENNKMGIVLNDMSSVKIKTNIDTPNTEIINFLYFKYGFFMNLSFSRSYITYGIEALL